MCALSFKFALLGNRPARNSRSCVLRSKLERCLFIINHIYRQARSLPTFLSEDALFSARTILDHPSTPLLYPCQPYWQFLSHTRARHSAPQSTLKCMPWCENLSPIFPACGSNEPAKLTRRLVIYRWLSFNISGSFCQRNHNKTRVIYWLFPTIMSPSWFH
jgi:hypothetical protein